MIYKRVCGAYRCTDPNCWVEYGYCHCGCGEETNLVLGGNKAKGWIETPRRFIKHHNVRGKTAQDEANRERGQTYVRADGYRSIALDADSVFCGMTAPGARYVPEHTLVLALLLVRPLEPNETVWHISGDKSDNRPQNLILLASQQALDRTVRGEFLLPDDIVWRPAWTKGLPREELIARVAEPGLQA